MPGSKMAEAAGVGGTVGSGVGVSVGRTAVLEAVGGRLGVTSSWAAAGDVACSGERVGDWLGGGCD